MVRTLFAPSSGGDLLTLNNIITLIFELFCGISFGGLDDLFLSFDDVFIQRQKVVFSKRLVLGWVSHGAGRPEKYAGPGMKGHGRKAGF